MLSHRVRSQPGSSFSSRFLAAVLLLIIIEAVGLHAFGEHVTMARLDPALLNDTGRQTRIISQIDALAHHFRYARSDSMRNGVREQLRADADELALLTARTVEGAYSDNARAHLNHEPVQLAARLNAYADAASALGTVSDANGATSLIEAIAGAAEPLRDDVDGLTQLLEDDYRKTLRRSQTARLAGGGLTFIILLLLGLFVFSPVEAEIRDRERRFRLLVENAYDLISVLTPEGKFKFVSPSLHRITGYTPAEFGRKSALELIHPDDGEFVKMRLYELATSENGAVVDVEFRILTKDGEERYLESIGQNLLEDSEIAGLIVNSRDITDRKRTEHELEKRTALLEERTKDLEAANEDLEAFAYSVSHDLRAPIRSLSGFSKLALKNMNGSADESTRHYLTRIQANAGKMGSLVEDLLAYSRIGRITARRSKIDLGPLIDEITKDLLASEDERDVILKVDDLSTIEADPTLIRQVFQNLLSNALKFTRKTADPRIHVGATEIDGETAYFVSDNGIGFDMKYAGRLFGVFHRLHGSDAYEGTGAGLAIVDRIVRKHGGRIWAEAEPDRGATFYFTLDDRGA